MLSKRKLPYYDEDTEAFAKIGAGLIGYLLICGGAINIYILGSWLVYMVWRW